MYQHENNASIISRSYPFRQVFCSCVVLLSLPSASVHSMALLASSSSKAAAASVVRIPRTIWRQAALHHQDQVKELLLPALLPEEDYKSLQQQQRRQRNNIQTKQNNKNKSKDNASQSSQSSSSSSQNNRYHYHNEGWFRPLDPNNPVCNFLIEYYGLKGHKGTKRLARWSPSPNLLLRSAAHTYTTLEEFQEASRGVGPWSSGNEPEEGTTPSDTATGVFLEDVTEEDFATLLHLRGAILESDGALYSPSHWFDAKKKQESPQQQQQHPATTTTKKHPASAFLWYRSVLQQTLQAEPILHCHGLHEWAMVFHPAGEPPPPSAKYQNHLKLRVSQQVINQAVERKGISCTHVDALRFFAPAAGPLNHHGASLERTDQLRLEQVMLSIMYIWVVLLVPLLPFRQP